MNTIQQFYRVILLTFSEAILEPNIAERLFFSIEPHPVICKRGINRHRRVGTHLSKNGQYHIYTLKNRIGIVKVKKLNCGVQLTT